MSDTTKGIWLIILSMFLLNASDAFIKVSAGQITFGHFMVSMGLIGIVVTGGYTLLAGRPIFRSDFLQPALLARVAFDVVGACLLFIALAKVDLSLVAVVTQASPILIAVFAAILLRETVGWQRWASILAGFIGVLFIVDPLNADFDPNVFYAIGALIGLTGRDFATRFVSQSVNAVEMSYVGFLGVLPVGLVICLIDGTPFAPDALHWFYLLAAIFIGIGGLIAIAAAMRFGDLSATAPFRYSRVIFAVIVGYFAFGEWPTQTMWIGIALVIGSGVFLLSRKRALRQTGTA